MNNQTATHIPELICWKGGSSLYDMYTNCKQRLGHAFRCMAYPCVSALLWVTERFIKCDHPFSHKRYTKLVKIKTKLEFRQYCPVPYSEYSELFHFYWKHLTNFTCPSAPPIMVVRLALRLNFKFMFESPLQSMCGVQPMIGPVHLVYSLIATNLGVHEDGSTRKSIELVSQAVEAKTRKLKTGISLEASVDNSLCRLHGISPEDELTNMIFEEISDEYIGLVAGWINDECEKVQYDLSSPTTSVPSDASLKIGISGTHIKQQINRDVGNVLWANSETVNMLATNNENFSKSENYEGEFGDVIRYVGILNGNIEVYRVDSLPDDVDAIIGYKGSKEVDSGLMVCPYVPVIIHGPVMDPDSFMPAYQILSRVGDTRDQPADSPVEWKGHYRVIKFINKDKQLLQEAA